MLTPLQTATLHAAAARIVPADDFPSAADAGAVNYVCLLLGRDLPHRWPELHAGLDRLAAAGFAERSAEQQDAHLQGIETAGTATDRAFVAWLVELVLESYYADPANVGNAGAVSWRMVGYDPRVPGYDGTDSGADR